MSRTTRRRLLRNVSAVAGSMAVGRALAGVNVPAVHPGEDNTVRMALIGCGGRGSGAVANACEASSASGGPVRLVAMADVQADRLATSHAALSKQCGAAIDVPEDRRFLGFDAWRHAIDCLRPGDVALLTTHAAFRAAQLEYAIQKGVNVFMEKSFAPDPAGIRDIIRLGQEAEAKNLRIATGLMCRHSTARQEMISKVREGALGDVLMLRAFRMEYGTVTPAREAEEDELLWQIRNPYSFLWLSTGRFIDYLIHQVDECCWIKDSWPVSAHGLGGRVPDNADAGQNFDSYAIEYTFADGTKAFVDGRFMPGCHCDFATFIHGSKAAAQFSGYVHNPTAFIYKDQRTERSNVAWKPKAEERSPYVAEWEALLRAIRTNVRHNEAERSAKANLAAIMGRAAVHSGKIITWDEAMKSEFRFCQDVKDLAAGKTPPVSAPPGGRYPVPVPGKWTEI